MKIKKSLGDNIFDIVNALILILVAVLSVYPLIYVLFCSLSDPSALMRHRGIMLTPQGFSLCGYQLVFADSSVVTGYMNTIFYVVIGTTVNVFFTAMSAYVLSRKEAYLVKYITVLVVVTMFFSGGLIPFYLQVKGLHLYNSRLALIIPTAISVWNLIVMRTAFVTMPDSMVESAQIDGAGHMTIFLKIGLPLVKATVAVITLYYAVGHWNSWFNAMIFLKDRDKYPLQLFLREILIINDTSKMTAEQAQNIEIGKQEVYQDLVKYCTIMVSTLPILSIYPFLQKYFVKGVMIGSLKG